MRYESYIYIYNYNIKRGLKTFKIYFLKRPVFLIFNIIFIMYVQNYFFTYCIHTYSNLSYIYVVHT